MLMKIFIIIYIVSLIIHESYLFYILKTQPMDGNDITNIVGMIFMGIVPFLNTIIAFAVIYFTLVEILGEYNTKSTNEIYQKEKSIKKQLKDLKKSLIKANFFKNEQEIEDFVNGTLLMEKLTETQEEMEN